MKNRESYEFLKDVLQQKINITKFAQENNATKQNINFKIKALCAAISEDKEYINAFSNIIENQNKIVKIENIEDKMLLDVFCYINKKKIYDFEGKLFYSTIEIDTLNDILKETFTDLKKIDVEKALEANNIKADKEFIELYDANTTIVNFKVRPLDIVENILKQHNAPMEKMMLIQKATSMGVKEKTVVNIFRNVSNNEDKVIILGDTVCDRDVFFDNYIDLKVAHKFVTAAVALCEKNRICATDIKWIKTNVEAQYPEIDISSYSYYELKAILSNETELFEKGVKFNLKYLGNKCQFTPSNVTELVQKVLEAYKLPISLKFLMKKLEENGKSFSITTLSSIILPNNDNFAKVRSAGWVLAKNADFARKLIEDAESIGIEEIINSLKKSFKVVTMKDLATKMNISSITILDAYYKNSTIDAFITKLNENGFKIKIKNGVFTLAN